MPATQDQLHLAHCNLKLLGTQADPAIMVDLLEVTIENSLLLPDVCSLHIYDNTFAKLDSDTFKHGTDVEVLIGYDDKAADSASNMISVFHGEITAVEMEMNSDGETVLIAHCMDLSHRLHRGRKSRTFVNVSDSDVVHQLLGEAGLTAGTVDGSSIVHDWLMQNNQTDWEFLSERAKRVGYRLFVSGKNTVNFQNVSDSASTTHSLTWGEDLLSFRPRITAGLQVDQVIVRGWDRLQKQAIVGNVSSSNGLPQIGASSDGGRVAQNAFGSSAIMTLVDHPVFTQSEAQSLAQSIKDDIGGDFVEAEGRCIGNPNLKPGVGIQISNVGTKYSGTYLLSSTTHSYSAHSGYKTEFVISGKRPKSLTSLLSDDNDGTRAKLGGNILIGIVTDNKDPSNLGRVKVKFPSINETDASDWAALVSPMGGKGRGIYFIPEINDEVLCAFEHGDIRRPYVLGGLWNGVDTPIEGNDVATSNGQVNHRIIKTRIGHTILLDDTDGTGSMTMTTCDGHVLTLDDKDKKIEAKTTSGHTVTLDDQNGKIVIVDKTTNNKMTINSNDNSIAVECVGDFKVTAQGQVSITGQQGIQMTTPMQLKASADAGMNLSTNAQMSLKAEAQMSIEATGPTSVKGAIVQIN